MMMRYGSTGTDTEFSGGRMVDEKFVYVSVYTYVVCIPILVAYIAYKLLGKRVPPIFVPRYQGGPSEEGSSWGDHF